MAFENHSESTALDVRVDVDTLKLKEHNTQDRNVSAIESEGVQGDEHQAASAVPASSGQTQVSCTGDEAHQAPNPICSKEIEVLCKIAENYLMNTPPRCKKEHDEFEEHLKKMRLHITGVRIGSLLITVKCDSLQILERLWEDYSCGQLGEVVQKSFVTEEILTELGLAELKLKTTISEEEYKACKKYLGKDPGREADETDDDDDSASEDEGQCGNVAVPDEQPIHVHFLDEEHLFQRREDDDDQTERVEEKLKTGTDEGSSVSEDEEADDGDVSASDDEDQCGNVTIPVEQPIHVRFADEENVRDKEDNLQTETVEEKLKTGTDEGSSISKDEDQCGNVTIPVEQPSRVHFADEENVRDKEDNLQTEIVEEELKTGTDEGSLVSKDEGISYWMSSTFESSSYASLGSSLSTGLTFPFRSWEYDLHEIVTTGLEKFDVGSPKELQDYLTYLAREMDSAGLLRTRGSVLDKPPSAWEHLSKKGDLTSRTPEEQPYRKEEKTPGVVMQETSKPVQESPSVKHLRETMDDKRLRVFVIIHVTESAWQVVMLFWDKLLHRDSKDGDEDAVSGDLKSRKLTWWPTDEDHGLKVLCKLLTVEDCKLDSLTLHNRKLTEEGIKHIAEALSSSHCRLQSLDLRWNVVTDQGVKHIAEALSSSHCRLESLDLSWNELTDQGVKHIAEALSSSHCCLQSLDLRWNVVTDEGVKHIADALSNTYCRLKGLFLSSNDNITDKGLRLSAEALMHSNYQLEADRLFIVVTAKVRSRMSEEGLS